MQKPDGRSNFCFVMCATTNLPKIPAGDSTADLDYTSPFALDTSQENTSSATYNASAILRSSTNPSQNVSLILPTNGQPGSLGISGNIEIEVRSCGCFDQIQIAKCVPFGCKMVFDSGRALFTSRLD